MKNIGHEVHRIDFRSEVLLTYAVGISAWDQAVERVANPVGDRLWIGVHTRIEDRVGEEGDR